MPEVSKYGTLREILWSYEYTICPTLKTGFCVDTVIALYVLHSEKKKFCDGDAKSGNTLLFQDTDGKLIAMHYDFNLSTRARKNC
jgi:hypothetical protein